MMKNNLKTILVVFVSGILFLCLSGTALPKEVRLKWEILDPEGVIKIEPVQVNPHPSTLEGKTILLRWNGKHNGDKFLERIGELLVEKIKGIKIIKSWEVAPETVDPITGSQERSEQFAKTVSKFKPDLVIGAQSD